MLGYQEACQGTRRPCQGTRRPCQVPHVLPWVHHLCTNPAVPTPVYTPQHGLATVNVVNSQTREQWIRNFRILEHTPSQTRLKQGKSGRNGFASFVKTGRKVSETHVPRP